MGAKHATASVGRPGALAAGAAPERRRLRRDPAGLRQGEPGEEAERGRERFARPRRVEDAAERPGGTERREGFGRSRDPHGPAGAGDTRQQEPHGHGPPRARRAGRAHQGGAGQHRPEDQHGGDRQATGRVAAQEFAERHGLADLGQPARPEQRIDAREGVAETVRVEGAEEPRPGEAEQGRGDGPAGRGGEPRRRGRERQGGEAADPAGGEVRSPEGVAAPFAPAIRRDLRQDHEAGRRQDRDRIGPQGSRKLAPAQDPAQADGGGRDEGEGEVLQVDRQRQGRDGARAGEARRPAPRVADPRHGGAGQHRQQRHLQGVVVDMAGDEDARGLETAGGEEAGGERRARRGQEPSAEARLTRHEDDQQGHGLDEPGQALGRVRRRDRAEEDHQGRHRQVGEARPVHRHAMAGREPVLHEVEPPLPRQEVPHLDGPHRVVGVEEDARRPDRDRLGGRQDQDRRDAQQHGRAVPPRRRTGHAPRPGLGGAGQGRYGRHGAARAGECAAAWARKAKRALRKQRSRSLAEPERGTHSRAEPGRGRRCRKLGDGYEIGALR